LLVVTLAAIAIVAARGGVWFLLVAPLSVLLVGLTRIVPAARPGEWLETGTTALLGIAATGFVVLGVLPHLGLYRPITVLSGSMRPAFAPGDMIFVTPEATSRVRVGQVITYEIPIGDHHVESHRVIRVVSGGNEPVVVTKGDANTAADPWLAQLHGNAVWRERVHVPMLGLAILALRSPFFHGLTVLLLPALLLGYGLTRIWRTPAPKPKPASAPLRARTNP
jgi:signal peptidase